MDYTERVTFTSVWETTASEDDIQHWIDTNTSRRRSLRKYGGMLASDPPLIVDFNLHNNLCELSVTFPEQFEDGVFVQYFEFHHEYADDYHHHLDFRTSVHYR